MSGDADFRPISAEQRARWDEQDRIAEDHRGAHNRGKHFEIRAAQLLTEGRTNIAAVVALLAISCRLEEVVDRLDNLENLG
jgi:hypothetical protein